MPEAMINGQKIHYDDTGGDGVPVILAHGFLMDLEMFVPQVAVLAPEFRVITWDERGFGKTRFDGQPFTYWDSANDCLGLMDHLGIEQAIVGGMSQGGYLSLRVALTAPHRVRALVLIDTQAASEDPALTAGYQQMLDTWAAVGPVDELAKWKARSHGDIVEPGRCLLNRDDISDRLHEIECPALIIHGTDDAAISLGRMQAMAEGLKDHRIVTIDGAAHAANLTHPEPVNAALLPFLREMAHGA